jgi:hypothetical protein
MPKQLEIDLEKKHTWEKIFSNHISTKGCTSKIHKELVKVNRRKMNNPVRKWSKDLCGYFSKEEDVRIANNLIKQLNTKQCSMTLATWENLNYQHSDTLLNACENG